MYAPHRLFCSSLEGGPSESGTFGIRSETHRMIRGMERMSLLRALQMASIALGNEKPESRTIATYTSPLQGRKAVTLFAQNKQEKQSEVSRPYRSSPLSTTLATVHLRYPLRQITSISRCAPPTLLAPHRHASDIQAAFPGHKLQHTFGRRPDRLQLQTDASRCAIQDRQISVAATPLAECKMQLASPRHVLAISH